MSYDVIVVVAHNNIGASLPVKIVSGRASVVLCLSEIAVFAVDKAIVFMINNKIVVVHPFGSEVVFIGFVQIGIFFSVNRRCYVNAVHIVNIGCMNSRHSHGVGVHSYICVAHNVGLNPRHAVDNKIIVERQVAAAGVMNNSKAAAVYIIKEIVVDSVENRPVVKINRAYAKVGFVGFFRSWM